MFLFRRTSFAVVFILIGFAMHSSEAIALSSDAADRASVIEAVKTIFVAAKADDLNRFHSVIARGFYIYDNGARFDGDAIMLEIKSAHEAGNTFDWNVTEPKVHVTGNSPGSPM